MRKQVTLEDILREEGAQQAWDQLIGLGVPPDSLQFSLLVLANERLAVYPPRLTPKEVRSFAGRLRKDADKIAQILLLEPFLEGLTNAGARLPSLLKGFADEIERLKFYLPKRRHKPEMWVEIGIVNQVVGAGAFERATKTFVFDAVETLINAAYAAAVPPRRRTVDAVNLQKAWDRYSHMRKSGRLNPSPE